MKKYKITNHSSTKMAPVHASIKSNEKEVYSSVKDNREVRKQELNLGQLVRTADIKKVISKDDSTNNSHK